MVKHFAKRIKKQIAVLMVGVLAFGHLVTPLAYAQEATPTPEATPTQTQPEPTPTTDVIVQNTDTTVQSDTTSQANTGGNDTTQVSPTPTPLSEEAGITPTETPTGSPEPTPTEIINESTESALLVNNEATSSSNVTVDTNTGSNSIETNSSSGGSNNGQTQSAAPATPTPTETVTLSTGDSVAVTVIDNQVNTTSVNSDVIYHTINLYANESGTIDLSLPGELAQLLVTQAPDDPTISALFSVQNNATVMNTVSMESNTGLNTATGSGTVTVTTGDAIALLSLLNRINFVMVNSVVHVAVINIFGNFTGNILLPDLMGQLSTPCETCGSTTINNTASVTNTVTATADTGNNAVTAEGGAIETGNAQAAIQLFDLVNTLVYGSQYATLYINTFGSWNGQFLGWATPEGLSLSPSYTPSVGCASCIGNINVQNQASVTNTVSMMATTGSNTLTASASGTITTGNAYLMANIVNFVNTTLIHSFGFFGFINVFGSWTGDVGSKSLFPPEPSQAAIGGIAQEQQSGSTARESGGQLTVSTGNNVGDYVLPGDTVTIFANVKNPGSGTVYDTKMIIMLLKDKTEVETIVVPIGNMPAGKGIKFSSGLVLSKSALGGPYAVRVAAYGYTGPQNVKVSSWAESYFTIYGTNPHQSAIPPQTVSEQSASAPTVMGTATAVQTDPNVLLALLTLLLLIPEYLFIRLYPKRKYIQVMFAQALEPRAFLNAVRMLL